MRGGVSSWADDMIRHMPEHEFVLWTIGDLEKNRGQFRYELPSNVVEVHENFLDSALNLRTRRNVNIKFSALERQALSNLIRCRCTPGDWLLLQKVFHVKGLNPIEFLMSNDFLDILKEYANEEYPFAGFSNLFWTIRSMFLPLLYLIRQPVPEADIYHSISTGYAGVLGAMASLKNSKPYILTEHGIYTREREEEILYSEWINPYFKSLWISMFKMYGEYAYSSAKIVTSLFSRAKQIQEELGSQPERGRVISNGIILDNFVPIPAKQSDSFIDIGAIVRFAPIKDIKTLIYAFASLRQEVKNVRLHILGPIDDREYYQECQAQIEYLRVPDIILAGEVNTKEYLKKLDFTVLTSISEGQPLVVMESMAAGRPVVATNVGCCREMLMGDEGDNLGQAGICVPPMHQSKLYEALLQMCQDSEMRQKMSIVGQTRAKIYFDHRDMIQRYNQVYAEVG